MLNFFGVVLLLHRRRLRRRVVGWAAAVGVVLVTCASLTRATVSRYPYKRQCSVYGQTNSETRSWEAIVEQFRLQHRDRCPGGLAELVEARREYLLDAWGRPYELTCVDSGAMRVCSRGDDADDPGDDICSDG